MDSIFPEEWIKRAVVKEPCRCRLCKPATGYKLSCNGTYCWTFDACFRDILDLNFTISEVQLFNTICESGMVILDD